MESNLPTVSLCMFIHNEMHILPHMLLYEMRWADQVCILDMASTDGLKEFCEAALRPQDVYVRREKNTCALLGFAEAKNAAIGLSTCDFAYFAGANSIVRWGIQSRIKQILKNKNAPVLEIATVNVHSAGPELYSWERQVARQAFGDTHTHLNFIRRGSGIDIKGYIHEEPHVGEVRATELAVKCPIVRYHFDHPNSRYARHLRYAWMLRRAMRDPQLQKYTNRWWYDEYFPQNKDKIEEQANQFELLFSHELL